MTEMTNVNRFIMKNVGRTEKNVNIDDKKKEITCRRNEKKNEMHQMHLT